MATEQHRTGSGTSPGPQPISSRLTEEALLANADALLASLDQWRWPGLPARPEELIQTDQELWQAFRKQDRGEKISTEDKKQLQLLGSWRSAVLDIEAKVQGRLLTVAGVLRLLEQHQRIDDAANLRSWLLEQYCCRLPEPCPSYSNWLRGWAEHFGRDTVVLPVWLRRMTRPPAAEGWRKTPTAQRSFADAEDE
jgi:hypothetical protein